MHKVILLCLAVWNICAAANLQSRDLLFLSSHRQPTTVVSNDKLAFVVTEGGVLLYDYRRAQWVDNIAPREGVIDVSFNPDRNQILMLKSNGGVLEYNPAFRRVTPTTTPFKPNPTGTTPSEMNGISMGSDFTFMGDAVRDRYNRRFPITLSRNFDYDHLWILTNGHGPFLGSLRRKDVASLWFGLYDSSVTALYANDKMIWFGSPNPEGALIRCKTDLTEWKTFLSQQDIDFPDGSIRDIVEWRGFLWLATVKGVTRQDQATGRFRMYRNMLGSTDLSVLRLFVHQNRLYAGTEKGVAVLDAPEGSFHDTNIPLDISPTIWDFCSKDQDLWVATRFGLFVLQKTGWKSIQDVSKNVNVLEATGVNVSSVVYKDSVLYWAGDDRVFEKPRGKQPKTLIPIQQVFRLSIEGDAIYAGFPGGVRVLNLKSKLWVDFLLEDGIPGRKVQSFLARNGVLWIGTDLGVMRINLKPYLPN